MPLRPTAPTYTVTEPVVTPIPVTDYWKEHLPALQDSTNQEYSEVVLQEQQPEPVIQDSEEENETST